MRNSKYFLALGLAGALTFGATYHSMAAPAVSNTAVAKAPAADTISVQWRRWGWRGGGWGRGWGRGPGLGIGLGLGLAGAALASPYYGGCGYGPCGYGYDYSYGYAPAYAYAPVVAVGPGYGWGWGGGWGWRRPYWRRHWW